MLTIECRLTDLDQEVLALMRASGGYLSDQDVVMSALWQHAQHLEIDVPAGVFAVGAQQPTLFDREAKA